RSEHSCQLLFACTMLGRLAGEVDLSEQFNRVVGGTRRALKCVAQIGCVERVDDVEAAGGFPGLVRLKMPHEMPPNRQIGGAIHFVDGFLHSVLTKIDLAGFRRDADVFDPEGFSDSDEADRRRVSPDSAGRTLDTVANATQPGPDAGGSHPAKLSNSKVSSSRT